MPSSDRAIRLVTKARTFREYIMHRWTAVVLVILTGLAGIPDGARGQTLEQALVAAFNNKYEKYLSLSYSSRDKVWRWRKHTYSFNLSIIQPGSK